MLANRLQVNSGSGFLRHTYIDMIDQVISDRQVNPGIASDHSRAILR